MKEKSSFFLFLLYFSCLLSSCASVPTLQPQINALAISGRLDKAIDLLNEKGNLYGPNNQLLYLLDKGLILHLAGRYKESIPVFEKAKNMIDEMYTESLSKIAATWLVNNYSAPYRGENFEHILVNVFQALNFVALGNIPEALVEARDMDLKINAIKNLYVDSKKHIYRDDAFARFFVGILFENTGNQQDLNDACISYKKALEAYESSFYKSQGITIPEILKENLLASAKALGFPDFEEYRKKFPETHFLNYEDRLKKAEVYLIQYNGLSPVKHPNSIYLPLPGAATKLSFPQYDARTFDIASSTFKAAASFRQISLRTELADNIESLAQKDLETRKAGIYAKAIGRPVIKYITERVIEEKIQEKNGKGAGYGIAGASSLYNIFSERADLRSWQTLPAQIRISRLFLEPGEYNFSLVNFDDKRNLIEEDNLGVFSLRAGEKKFIITRTIQ